MPRSVLARIFKSESGGEKSLFFIDALTLLLPHVSPKIKASKQQLISWSRENVKRCHIKAEFGKVRALDYLLQRFSVAIQCVDLNHCRLPIDLYVLCFFNFFNDLYYYIVTLTLQDWKLEPSCVALPGQ